MSHDLLRLAHLLGAVTMAAGLVGVFVADLRARGGAAAPLRAEALALIALFYDGVVLPGAVLLGISGGVMVATTHGAAAFALPWLAAMMALFALEFVEGNTITRLAFRRQRRLARPADAGALARFTHFLDLPVVAVILGLGVLRPLSWLPILAAIAAAVAVAALLTWAMPRLVPWRTY